MATHAKRTELTFLHHQSTGLNCAFMPVFESNQTHRCYANLISNILNKVNHNDAKTLTALIALFL